MRPAHQGGDRPSTSSSVGSTSSGVLSRSWDGLMPVRQSGAAFYPGTAAEAAAGLRPVGALDQPWPQGRSSEALQLRPENAVPGLGGFVGPPGIERSLASGLVMQAASPRSFQGAPPQESYPAPLHHPPPAPFDDNSDPAAMQVIWHDRHAGPFMHHPHQATYYSAPMQHAASYDEQHYLSRHVAYGHQHGAAASYGQYAAAPQGYVQSLHHRSSLPTLYYPTTGLASTSTPHPSTENPSLLSDPLRAAADSYGASLQRSGAAPVRPSATRSLSLNEQSPRQPYFYTAPPLASSGVYSARHGDSQDQDDFSDEEGQSPLSGEGGDSPQGSIYDPVDSAAPLKTKPETSAAPKRRKQAASSGQTRKYVCEVCTDRSFARPSALKIHMLVHTKVKDFVCPYCDRPFAIHSNLKRHIKLHENGTGGRRTKAKSGSGSASAASSRRQSTSTSQSSPDSSTIPAEVLYPVPPLARHASAGYAAGSAIPSFEHLLPTSGYIAPGPTSMSSSSYRPAAGPSYVAHGGYDRFEAEPNYQQGYHHDPESPSSWPGQSAVPHDHEAEESESSMATVHTSKGKGKARLDDDEDYRE